jgi:hypothetical protein
VHGEAEKRSAREASPEPAVATEYLDPKVVRQCAYVEQVLASPVVYVAFNSCRRDHRFCWKDELNAVSLLAQGKFPDRLIKFPDKVSKFPDRLSREFRQKLQRTQGFFDC